VKRHGEETGVKKNLSSNSRDDANASQSSSDLSVVKVKESPFHKQKDMVPPSSTSRVRTPGRLLKQDLPSVPKTDGIDRAQGKSEDKGGRNINGMRNIEIASPRVRHFDPQIINDNRTDRVEMNGRTVQTSSKGLRAEMGNNHQYSSQKAGSTVESTASSSARNLISMFESKRSNTNAIFPPGEHWQYSGKNYRRGPRGSSGVGRR